MARAAALLQDARERFETAGRALADILARCEAGAPNDPGLFARIGRMVTSFTTGVAEGVWGIGEGAVTLAGVAVKLNPARALWDPHGSNAAHESVMRGVEHALKNPGDVGKALVDADTWREDPARAFGRLVPDLIGIFMTAGAVGTARGAAASNRLRSAAEVIEQARAAGRAVFEPINKALANRRIRELGLDPASAVGRAARKQLNPPFGEIDHWVPSA